MKFIVGVKNLSRYCATYDKNCTLFQDDEFFSWVNPAYLDIGVQTNIQEKFEAESEIELTDFLEVNGIYHTVLEAVCC